MKSLESICADLAEYIAARQKFLKRAADTTRGTAMNTAQHLEVARLLINAERFIRVLDRAAPADDLEADLVGAMDAFYTGLAHLGMAFDVRWVVAEKPNGTTESSAPRDASGRADDEPAGRDAAVE